MEEGEDEEREKREKCSERNEHKVKGASDITEASMRDQNACRDQWNQKEKGREGKKHKVQACEMLLSPLL